MHIQFKILCVYSYPEAEILAFPRDLSCTPSSRPPPRPANHVHRVLIMADQQKGRLALQFFISLLELASRHGSAKVEPACDATKSHPLTYRHDFYQTDSDVIVSLYIKGYGSPDLKDKANISFEAVKVGWPSSDYIAMLTCRSSSLCRA